MFWNLVKTWSWPEILLHAAGTSDIVDDGDDDCVCLLFLQGIRRQ